MQQQRTFLAEVASSLYKRHGGDFSSLALLFPSRRARLFFAEELSSLIEEPVWEPEWLSMEGLMEELSGLHKGDRLRLVVELYRIYSRYHKEEFDRFYFWGEMLLSDFDMIDKYRVDAEALYANISDLKELEADLSYLTLEQRALINRFWEGVLNESADTEERERFLRVWRTLGSIYREYREHLLTLGFGYEGLVQRRAAERLERHESAVDSARTYVVAGFNALTACEKVLFEHLRTVGAEFFWDYDESYLRSEVQEAGMFMRENCRKYPELLSEITHDNAKSDKKIKIVSTASDAVQCKVVNRLLDALRERDEKGVPQPLDRHTAVVLTNEELLMPLLYSITPSEEQVKPDAVNVTMGYPLKHTAAYTFVERLLSLQNHSRKGPEGALFYHADVSGVLAHPYLDSEPHELLMQMQEDLIENRRITVEEALLAQTPLLERLFRRVEGWQALADYLIEALSQVASLALEAEDGHQREAYLFTLGEEISKLRNSIISCEIEIATSTFVSLLRRHLQGVRIPFEGEPLNGLQVMGILETRNLDFDRVIILSMTDDNFPGRLDAHASYIPYNLRAAYGLPTPEHHEGVHAYYFYRLLQRAREVVLCYCSKADKLTTGEPSRYIRQLTYESGRELEFCEVGVDVNLPLEEDLVVEKRGAVRRALEAYLRKENPRSLSPTALSRYIACPLKFYFASIAQIKEREEITEDVDNPLFGTILHAAMEDLYASLMDNDDPSAEIDSLLRDGKVDKAVRHAIEQELFREKPTPESAYSGQLLLVRDMVVRYIREGIMAYDHDHPDFKVIGLEKPVDAEFSLDSERRILLAGKADRLDRMHDGTVRVVDYKTGSIHLQFKGLEDLFSSKKRGSNANLFQTLLYALMWRHRHGDDVSPALFYVRNINQADFSPYPVDLTVDHPVRYSLYEGPFEALLREKLTELFDYETPFTAVSREEQDSICTYCDYRSVCRR